MESIAVFSGLRDTVFWVRPLTQNHPGPVQGLWDSLEIHCDGLVFVGRTSLLMFLSSVMR